MEASGGQAPDTYGLRMGKFPYRWHPPENAQSYTSGGTTVGNSTALVVNNGSPSQHHFVDSLVSTVMSVLRVTRRGIAAPACSVVVPSGTAIAEERNPWTQLL